MHVIALGYIQQSMFCVLEGVMQLSEYVCRLYIVFFIRKWFIRKYCSTAQQLRKINTGFLRTKKVD